MAFEPTYGSGSEEIENFLYITEFLVLLNKKSIMVIRFTIYYTIQLSPMTVDFSQS